MSKSIITVEKLSKAYRIGSKEHSADTMVGSLLNFLKSPLNGFKKLRSLSTLKEDAEGKDILWALKDVSFEVKQGEVVGVVGGNGAGKSTLLKILSRITEPTSGRVSIHGRVSSLLEVGTGFHPELTGRENIYMNGTILGMRKKEIDKKFDTIVDFSGVSKFLDTPTKRYSSGMQVRLAFAVAAHLEPEILIVDEVLAVGDAGFQKRCLDRMREIANEGRTILFVSHNLEIVDRLCTRAVLLKGGVVSGEGETQGIIAKYLSDGRSGTERELIGMQRVGDGRARFVHMDLLNDRNEAIEYHLTGGTLRVAMNIDVNQRLTDVGVAVVLSSSTGAKVVTSWNREANFRLDFSPGRVRCVCDFSSLFLRPGHELWISLYLEQGGQVVDWVDNVADVKAVAWDAESERLSTDQKQGIIACPQKWTVENIA